MATHNPSELDFRALMSLAGTYATHARYSVATECAWGASEVAIRLRRPDLWYSANELLVLIGVATRAEAAGIKTGGAL